MKAKYRIVKNPNDQYAIQKHWFLNVWGTLTHKHEYSYFLHTNVKFYANLSDARFVLDGLKRFEQNEIERKNQFEFTVVEEE